MLSNTRVSKRKGKPAILTRTTPNIKEGHSVHLSLHDAQEYVYAHKQAEGLRPRTLEGYRIYFGMLVDWLAEHYPNIENITQVTTIVVRDYILYLSNTHVNQRTGEIGLSPHTINISIRLLKAFFNVLFQEEIIDKNPMRSIKFMRADEDTFKPLTDDEIKRLLNTPDVKYFAQFRDLVSIYLILDTGIRSSEMFSLEMGDIDFKSRAIYLPASKTKNRKPRVLPLSNKVMRLLLELITEVKANFDTSYVFVSNFGEKYLPTSFRRRLHIYKNKSNIDKPVNAHGLRHQFCRDYIMNGGDIFSLQRIAGHSDISTTRKYIQFTTDDIKKKHAQFSPIGNIRSKYR